MAAVWGIHQNEINLFIVFVIPNIFRKGILMVDAWVIHIMEQHIGGAQHIRKLFFFHAEHSLFNNGIILGFVLLFPQMLHSVNEEASRAARKIRCDLAKLWIYFFSDKLRQGTGRVEFAGAAGALQAFQQGFIDHIERMVFFPVIEINTVQQVDGFADAYAVLHVIV